MNREMKKIKARLHWSYNGQSGSVDRDEYVHWNEYKQKYEISEYMWFDGNYACDCNRCMFIGFKPETNPELFWMPGDMYFNDVDKHEGSPDERCGDKIKITKIESLDPDVESLHGDYP